MAGTEKAKWEILLSKLSKKGLPNPTGRLKQAHSISPPTEFPDNFIFSNILGSKANDLYYLDNNQIKTKTNNNGGILGGLSTGMPLVFSVVVKPTSSISLEQKTINIKEMKEDILKINGRHDACIVPRVLPVIEAIMALAILDEIL